MTNSKGGFMNAPRFASYALVACAASLAAAIASGCKEENSAGMVASAKDYLAKSDYKASEIQLKNVLQKDPRNAEARFLLGVTMNRSGDPVSAEKELRRAIEYNYPAGKVYPELAGSLQGQGDAKRLVADLADKKAADAGGEAALKTALGDGYIGLGQLDAAKAAYAAALAASPGYPRARVGEARLAALGRDLERAKKINDEVLQKTPTLPEAMGLKAELMLAAGRPEEAETALRDLVNAQPGNAAARFALISLLLDEKKNDQASAELEAMKKAIRGDVRTTYLEAMLAFQKGENEKAREAIQQVQKFAPDNPMVLQLAGAIEYRLGSLASAEDLLRKSLARAPQNLYARNLLAATLLRDGQASKAEDVVTQSLASAPLDPGVLRVAGEVAFAKGEVTKATEYYNQAASADKNNAAVRTRLGQIRLATGDADRAMLDFEAASQMDAGQGQADVALAATHLQRREYDKALAAIDALEKKQPKAALPWNMRGVVQAARGDTRAARANFEKALALQPNFVVAARNLALLDLADKNPAAAKKRLEDILAKEPTNDAASLALAEVEAASGGSKDSIAAILDRAVKANPGSAVARLALVNLYGRLNDPKAALAAAQAAASAIPGNAQILETLGALQQATGDVKAAISTFEKLVEQAPQSPGAFLRLAAAQLASKDYDGAIASLRKADQLRPEMLEARRQIVSAQLTAGRTEDALNEARAVQKLRPTEAGGYALEGEVWASQKKYPQAADAFRQAVRLQPAAPYVVRLHAMLKESGKTAEADGMAAKWIKDNPKDALVRIYLADAELREKDYKSAARLLTEVVDLQPNNAVALNNLAWAQNELKDPAALSTAQKALALAPGSAAVADTVGWILFSRGDVQRGLELMRKASAAAPQVPEIRMHLAKALIKAGDIAAARRELEAVVAMGDAGQFKGEAEGLLKGL